MARILFAGGGSLGHIIPACAVWQALERQGRGHQAHFVCSEREDDALFLTREGLPHTQIRARKLSPWRPFLFLFAYLKASSLIRQWKPTVIFSTGGAVSVPVALVAHRYGIPIVLHTCDAMGGKATRMIAKWATMQTRGFPADAEEANSKAIVTGNPVRQQILTGSREAGLALTGLSGKKPILLVMGGSQGASALNDVIIKHIDTLLENVDIVHLTGKGKEGASDRLGYWKKDSAYTELPHLYAIADLALSRAGAGGIAELAACRIPSILIPLPGLAENHQEANAQKAASSGGFLLLLQKQMEQMLIESIRLLAVEPEHRRQMQEKLQSFAKPEAAEMIAEVIVRAAG